MDLKDICDGCGRHPGVCMCSLSIGSQGVQVNHPNPTNLAGKLRIIASHIDGERRAKVAGTIAEVLRHEAKLAAQNGKYGIMIWLQEKKWSRLAAEQAAEELKRDGFDVIVGREVTAWYSNTDWDEEEYISVTWK